MLGVNLLWVLMLLYVFTNDVHGFFWLWNLSVMGIVIAIGMCGYCGYVKCICMYDENGNLEGE